MILERPPTPARLRAALARVDADLAGARLRLARLEVDAGCCGPDADEVAAKLAEAEARIAELAADREELVSGPVDAPVAVPTSAPANDVPAPDDWLTTREAAAIMRVTVKGLERMRAEGRGPSFSRIGHAVRYRRSDLRGAK